MRSSFTDSVRCYREAMTFLVCQMLVGLLAAWAVLSAVPAHAQPSLLASVQVERDKYGPAMTPAQVASLLNAVAWTHRAEGWGLLRKTGGTRCPLGDTFISCDILVHAPSVQHFDVLQDAENTARPVWRDVGPCVLGPSSGCEMSRFLAPTDPGLAAPPSTGGGGVPPVVTPPVDLGPVLTRLDALERLVQSLAATVPQVEQQVGAQGAELERLTLAGERLDALTARVDMLASRPIPVSCSASLNFGAGRVPISCRLN